MVQFLYWNISTLCQPIHTQEGFRFFALVSHMGGGVSDGKLELLAHVWVETHDIHIASRVRSGVCLNTGCVSRSGFSSNSHSH